MSPIFVWTGRRERGEVAGAADRAGEGQRQLVDHLVGAREEGPNRFGADVRIGVDRIPRRGIGGEELDDAVDVSGGMAGQVGLDG